MATMPEKKHKNCSAMNCITTSPRHDFSGNMISVYRGGAAETMQNSPRWSSGFSLLRGQADV
jgi:hypothetical protein